jgi:hypothetical protein
VANSIAPIAAIIYIYRYGELNAEAPVNKWILAYGGFGIVLGLLLYGYKVMKTIGYKLTGESYSCKRKFNVQMNTNLIHFCSIVTNTRIYSWIGEFFGSCHCLLYWYSGESVPCMSRILKSAIPY